MFGKKSKKQNKGIEKTAEEETQVVDPYDDEPDQWKQLSGADRAKAWYNLESLTAGSAASLSISTDQEAFSVYYDEAHRGNRCAEYALGKMYLTGTLTQQNTFQAGLWFSQAADLGSPFACYELAKMMFLGVGFGKDPTSAEQLYQKAYQSMLEIEKHFPAPAIEKKLAVICENGLCPDADPSAAGRWRQLAQGVSPSVEMDTADLETGRTSMQKADVTKPEEETGAPESFNDGITSETDMEFSSPESKTGRGSMAETDATETETGRASNVREIPVEYIYPAKDNPYAANDTDDAVHALAMSIEINGLLNPLVLHKISDTEYRIISGEKRYTAITQYLHWNTISATVKENLSSNAAQLMLHAANLDVREYTSAQKLKFYIDAEKLLQRMKKSGEYSGPMQKGIADMLGMSEHQIRKYQKIVESLPKRQLNKFKKGEISLEKAYKLARAAPVKKENTGRVSIPEPDAVEPNTGCASIPEPDAAEPEIGRASILKMDMVETKYEDPKTYQESISLLARLPTAPGESCAVRNGDDISIGTVDRMEVYQNALLISVLVDDVRRPYPVSLVGTELFLGPDCYRQAEEGKYASSF